MSLLAIASDWCKRMQVELDVVSVDHRLRPEAEGECKFVGRTVSSFGHQHTILRWQGKPEGNLQAEARRARYTMIAKWAIERDIPKVALGHTLDDQAETVILNLARGSGVYGLSAMPEELRRCGVNWIRPLLQLRRKDLRCMLRSRAIPWIDDPSNEDLRFDRVRIRQALPMLEQIGLTASALGRTAANMQRARQALAMEVAKAAQRLVDVSTLGVLTIEAGFWDLAVETRYRLFAAAVRFHSNERHSRRLSAIRNSISALRCDGVATISACVLHLDRQRNLRIVRDHRRCGRPVRPDLVWDDRWRLAMPPDSNNCRIGALGRDGLKQFPGRSAAVSDRRALLSSPALWKGDKVVESLVENAPGETDFILLKDRQMFLNFVKQV